MAAGFFSALREFSSALNNIGNAKLLEELQEGDLIEFPRDLFYSHWGVYIGNGQVVHLSGVEDSGPASFGHRKNTDEQFNIGGILYNRARVKKESFLTVAGESLAKINNEKDKEWRPLHPREIVKRARGMIGDTNYDLFSMNCEHFANWCRYNKVKSDQVDNFASGATLLGVGALAGLAIVGGVMANREEDEEKKKEKDKRYLHN